MNKLEFHYFHLMPWPYLPVDFDEKFDSTWVTLPNSIYDPIKGHQLYNRYLDEIERADKLGWDSVIVNEHHQNAHGTMPSPNIMAAVLTQRVKRAKIGIVGNALPLHDDPLRVAEEIAMLDVISGGRIISGFVRGTGMEYFSCDISPWLKARGFSSSRMRVSCFTGRRLSSLRPNRSYAASTGIDGEPLRQNVQSGIGVTVVNHATFRTDPFTSVQG